MVMLCVCVVMVCVFVCVCAGGEEIKSHWKLQIQYLAHKYFAELRCVHCVCLYVGGPWI